MGAVYSVLHIWSHGLGREALAFPFVKKKKKKRLRKAK